GCRVQAQHKLEKNIISNKGIKRNKTLNVQNLKRKKKYSKINSNKCKKLCARAFEWMCEEKIEMNMNKESVGQSFSLFYSGKDAKICSLRNQSCIAKQIASHFYLSISLSSLSLSV